MWVGLFGVCQQPEFLGAAEAFQLDFKAHGFGASFKAPQARHFHRQSGAGVLGPITLVMHLQALLRIGGPPGIEGAVRAFQQIGVGCFVSHPSSIAFSDRSIRALSSRPATTYRSWGSLYLGDAACRLKQTFLGGTGNFGSGFVFISV
jgi:hypothetical protein